MPRHETLTDDIIEYPDPTPEQAAFLAKAQAMVDDPKATEDDLVALLYGRQNPLLDHTLLPGRSMVTAATLKHPLYAVMGDLLDRKRLALGAFDIEEARARFTMTVQEAAKHLGVAENAIRQAIDAGKLPSWKINGRVMLEPQSVEAYQISRRGLSPRLQVRLGNTKGMSFRMKRAHDLENETSPEPNVVEGTLTKWRRCAVIFGGEGKYRFAMLEPGGEENEVHHGPFYVRGRFTIVEKTNNPPDANVAWKNFEPK